MPDEQPIKPVENYSRMPVGEVVTRGLAVAGQNGRQSEISPTRLRFAGATPKALRIGTAMSI